MSKGSPAQKMLTAVGAAPRTPFCCAVAIAFILGDKLTNGDDDASLIGDFLRKLKKYVSGPQNEKGRAFTCSPGCKILSVYIKHNRHLDQCTA